MQEDQQQYNYAQYPYDERNLRVGERIRIDGGNQFHQRKINAIAKMELQLLRRYLERRCGKPPIAIRYEPEGACTKSHIQQAPKYHGDAKRSDHHHLRSRHLVTESPVNQFIDNETDKAGYDECTHSRPDQQFPVENPVLRQI